MNQEQLDRIARMLARISDHSERTEITREIAVVLGQNDPSFGAGRFYELAQVEGASETASSSN
jgi:hypothetical protein